MDAEVRVAGIEPPGFRPSETLDATTVLGPLADDLAASALAVARRFAAGATMWCCAPQWPAHAHHVAVEFVHPVVVGTRALPAVAVADADPVAALRALAVAGDVLVLIAPADDPVAVDAARRAPAWGVDTIWIGAGPRPDPGAAEHVLWVDGDNSAAHAGGFVLLYHVLWELTHVCFEHPGLLVAPEPAEAAPTCATCADEGLLGEVVADDDDGLTSVRMADGVGDVDTTLVGPVRPHDLVLVHAGTAIARVDQAAS
jgi:hypothetical protein